jgi:cellulose synthase/poly-beta-1,6-N-acetylglucosamine synthase-like glycosyltransferase
LITPVGIGLVAASLALLLYAYVGYPLILGALARLRPPRQAPAPPPEWPLISITIPAYNEEAQIRETVESLLAIDYPADRRQILVVSDASTDGTDAIVAEYADRGVELLRMESRTGKTAAENAARRRLRGEIVVNTDASIRIYPDALKRLVSWFADPEVGVASGNDVSVARGEAGHGGGIAGEAGYVDYEMKVRALETRVDGIVGASGCLYAIRADLHDYSLPGRYSRDFAAAIVAREHGFRAVSVPDALCTVPRAGSLRQEYRRKVRTMVRGMDTLIYKRSLMNPFRYGIFAWMLFSHKLCRWLVPVAAVGAVAGIALLSVSEPWARWLMGAGVLVAALAAAGWYWSGRRPVPAALSMLSYLVAGNVAALAAWLRVLRGAGSPVWEPTRR